MTMTPADRLYLRGYGRIIAASLGLPRNLLQTQDARWVDIDSPDVFALPCVRNGQALQGFGGQPAFQLDYSTLDGTAVLL